MIKKNKVPKKDHATCSYKVISLSVDSMHIFRIQKRIIIRVMSGLRSRDSCKDAFKDWGILPLQSQYIFSLLIFVVNNMGFYNITNS
jgi:hypothetical protein